MRLATVRVLLAIANAMNSRRRLPIEQDIFAGTGRLASMKCPIQIAVQYLLACKSLEDSPIEVDACFNSFAKASDVIDTETLVTGYAGKLVDYICEVRYHFESAPISFIGNTLSNFGTPLLGKHTLHLDSIRTGTICTSYIRADIAAHERYSWYTDSAHSIVALVPIIWLFADLKNYPIGPVWSRTCCPQLILDALLLVCPQAPSTCPEILQRLVSLCKRIVSKLKTFAVS